MNQYLLILYQTPADRPAASPAAQQEMTQRYRDWARSMAERGLLAGGEKLTDDGGRHLRLKNGKPLASDGPYAEAHDVIGGYFLIKAENDAQAEDLALSCPHLAGAASQWIEIRRVETMG